MKPHPQLDDTLTRIEKYLEHPNPEAFMKAMLFQHARGLRQLRDALNLLAGDVEDLDKKAARHQALAKLQRDMEDLARREAEREAAYNKLTAKVWRIAEKVLLLIAGAFATRYFK